MMTATQTTPTLPGIDGPAWRPFCEFRVLGIPKGQPRARAFAMKGKDGKAHVRMYDAGTAEAWKGAVACAALEHLPTTPLDCPVSVSIEFYLPRRKGLYRKKDPEGRLPHTAKPDRDNLDKAVLDTMTALGFWRDDSQVCEGRVAKFYHSKRGRPGARITVEVWR